jgi:co-chaperonin GroES (HSP10)
MTHERDPKDVILEGLGDISGEKITNNQVLVAIYLRPKETAGGVILPDQYRDEDLYQGKCGLIVAVGPTAFMAKEGSLWAVAFEAVPFQMHDWVLFRASEGWPVSFNKTPCRMLDDISLRAHISHPDMVW